MDNTTDISEVDFDPRIIICEELLMPEYNQTFVIKDGEIHGGISYRSIREGFSPTSDVVQVNDISNGFEAAKWLVQNYEPDKVNGIYNIDFMVRDDGTHVLNEVNPGRFPAGIYPLREQFHDLVMKLF